MGGRRKAYEIHGGAKYIDKVLVCDYRGRSEEKVGHCEVKDRERTDDRGCGDYSHT